MLYRLFRRMFLALVSISLLAAGASASTHRGPTVVPTAEGQIGETPGVDDRILGPRFESIRGQAGEVLLGSSVLFGGVMPPPPAFDFLTDRLHGASNPVPITSATSSFLTVPMQSPASDRRRAASGLGDFVAFSFAVDGSLPQTMTVRIATFDEDGTTLASVPVAVDVPTFSVPDPLFTKTGVAVDDQGRATVVFTQFDSGIPTVRGQRVSVVTGAPIGGSFPIGPAAQANPDVALLDPAGDRLIVASNRFTNPPVLVGNIVDFSSGSPVVLPEFTIPNTPASFGNLLTDVAADPATGTSTVVWDQLTGVLGNPADVRARRFDAMGNPIGGDFQVNTLDANAQGQAAVAYGPNGNSAIIWAGDPAAPQGPEDLDVFGQAYDADGNPIGGEVPVNTFTTNTQDRPTVRFLPEPDAQGRSQFAVAWRDTGDSTGATPRGTGQSYRCFSIEGLEDPTEIFADGFESGDTTSWSETQPGS